MVLGSIIGIFGNKIRLFKEDLGNFQMDATNLAQHKTIIAGEFNFSFDKYYPSAIGKEILNTICQNHSLKVITWELPEVIDHIVMSNSIIKDRDIEFFEWNYDKTLSDHKGFCVTISTT